MHTSNFSRLVSAINAEARARKPSEGPSLMKGIYEGRRKHIESASVLRRASKTMSTLNRKLTPTRNEVIEKNRTEMTRFRKSLSTAVKNKELAAIDACRLEAQANQLSTQLSQRGLI